MQDNMEKFISEHSEEFDLHEPPEHLWSSIHKKMYRRRDSRPFAYYAAAAVVLLIAGSFLWVIHKNEEKQVPPANQEVAISPEIKKAEVYYASVVKVKRTELNRFSKDYPELCNDLDKELITLDTIYGQLKTEYKNANGNEAVQQALLENLQARVQLLNQQLLIIQDIRDRQSTGKQQLKSI